MYNIPKGWKVYNEKRYKKIAASTICGALLLSMAGCADTSWSVKRNDDETLSVGTYIYYMTQAYSEAKEKLANLAMLFSAKLLIRKQATNGFVTEQRSFA